jgi:hypothetical protein
MRNVQKMLARNIWKRPVGRPGSRMETVSK